MEFKNVMFGEEDGEFLPILSLDENADTSEIESLSDQEIGILPLKNTVLFPGVILPITINREKSIKLIEEAHNAKKYIGVVAQKKRETEEPQESDLLLKGSIAKILKIIKIPNEGITTVIIQGKSRFEISEFTANIPYFKANVNLLKNIGNLKADKQKAMIDAIRDVSEKIIQLSPNMPSKAHLFLRNIDDPLFLIHFIAGNLTNNVAEQQKILEQNNIADRAALLLTFLQKELQFVELKNKVADKTKTEIDKQQKEYFLQQQIKSIKDELGLDSNDKEIREMQKKAETKKWPQNVRDFFKKGLEKLERMNNMSPDYSVMYNHLDLLLELPWNDYSNNQYDLSKARKKLDDKHFGLERIKDRIIEYLAVLKLKGDLKSPILCFVGPPGIGKTSLGKSIAEAIDRKFIKISLGGLYDEAEIRGHRKTYIGAMPGRIIQALKKCNTSNPVILLDEIDKVGRDYRGDVSSALLEVLDPEQNFAFHDNYLELDYDLSKILFITTANDLQTIQPALRDRLEIIDLTGYALEEKVEIAKKHLIQKQKEAHGLLKQKISFSDDVLRFMVEKYTRETGVRELDRLLSSIMRNIALDIVLNKTTTHKIDIPFVEKILRKQKYANDEYSKKQNPGVAIGLAWTPFGGDILFIESVLAPGKGDLKLTGNLGNVMKESATTAFTFLKTQQKNLKIDLARFDDNHIHLHFPEGATPKDGPSAGITILTCLASLLLNKPVKPFLAMTGEITLRGQVLPVGGIKEKILAAKRAGLKEVILSTENEKDVQEIDPRFIKGLKFHYVKEMKEVLKIALNVS